MVHINKHRNFLEAKKQKEQPAHQPMYEKPVYKRQIRYFTKDGTPLNVNEANIDFVLDSDHPKHVQLNLKVPKFLDTELIKIDSQPTYIKVTINGKQSDG